MSKHSRWLKAESERWTTTGIISADQAARIRALYVEPAGGLSWGLIVFFGLGAVIVGLGVILLFAYNWDEIPKFAKLGLILGVILAAHGGGLRLRVHADWRSKLGEALSILGTMGFGAGIWLIAQIYHINEHFPTGFLVWALGALAMAWVLDSVAHGILAAILIAVWGGTEALEFDSPMEISGLLIVLGVVPLAWRLRSALLWAVVLASVYWVVLCNASFWGGSGAAFGNAFSISVLLIALSRLLGPNRPEAEKKVLGFFGLSGFVVCSYLLSFDGAARSLLRWSSASVENSGAMMVYRWLAFLLAAAAWILLLKKVLQRDGLKIEREQWLCPIGLLYVQGLAVAGVVGDGAFVAIVFNVVCLALAAAWMVRGCRDSNLRATVLGSVFLAFVVFARYFDLFDSLAVRGGVFVLFGAVLFAEGFYYRRLRRDDATETPRA